MTTTPPTPPKAASTPDNTVSTSDTSMATTATAAATVDEASSVVDTTLIEAAATDAATDLARTDATNITLATLAGVLLTILVAGAGLTTGDGSYPPPALVAMGAAAAALAAVLVVLTSAMWPRRGGTGGVPHYATHTPETLLAELTETTTAHWHAERAVAKSQIAARKHAAQRSAAAGLALAGVLLALATIVTLAIG